MPNLIKYELPDGTPFILEVEDSESQGRQRVSKSKDGIIQAEQTFTDAMKYIKPVAEQVLKTFKDMNTPDEITLDFGVRFTAKAGAIFTSVGAHATFKVSLKWKNEKTAETMLTEEMPNTDTSN